MQVLTARQSAMIKVHAYPHFVDVVAILNALAELEGKLPAAQVAAQAASYAANVQIEGKF